MYSQQQTYSKPLIAKVDEMKLPAVNAVTNYEILSTFELHTDWMTPYYLFKQQQKINQIKYFNKKNPIKLTQLFAPISHAHEDNL